MNNYKEKCQKSEYIYACVSTDLQLASCATFHNFTVLNGRVVTLISSYFGLGFSSWGCAQTEIWVLNRLQLSFICWTETDMKNHHMYSSSSCTIQSWLNKLKNTLLVLQGPHCWKKKRDFQIIRSRQQVFRWLKGKYATKVSSKVATNNLWM